MEGDLLRQHWLEARARLHEKLAHTKGITLTDNDGKDATAERTDELRARITMYDELLGDVKRETP